MVTSLPSHEVSQQGHLGCPLSACVLSSTSVISKLSPRPRHCPHPPSCFLQLPPASSKYTSPEPPAIFPARSLDTLGGPVAPPPPLWRPPRTHTAHVLPLPSHCCRRCCSIVTGVHSQGCDSITLYARIFFSHGHVCRQSLTFYSPNLMPFCCCFLPLCNG